MKTAGRAHRLACVFISMAVMQLWAAIPAWAMGKLIPLDNTRIDCTTFTIQGTFRPEVNTYTTKGECTVYLDPTVYGNEAQNWKVFGFTGGGSFDPRHNNMVQEKIDLYDPKTGQSKGKITSQFSCNIDPWLPNAIRLTCTKLDSKANFKTIESPTHLLQLYESYFSSNWDNYGLRPITAYLPATLQTEIARQHQIAMGVKGQPGPSASGILQSKAIQTYPTIVSPPSSQRFFAQSVVPIKLAPPKTVAATNYEVTVQRKDTNGNWVPAHSFPIGAAIAQSPSGYQGFGAGGPGLSKATVLLTSPGLWRLQARVLQPTPMAWSPWVEFLVEPPLSKGAIVQTPQQGIGAGTTLIRPRGVEEKGGPEGNQTVDQPVETEKKP